MMDNVEIKYFGSSLNMMFLASWLSKRKVFEVNQEEIGKETNRKMRSA